MEINSTEGQQLTDKVRSVIRKALVRYYRDKKEYRKEEIEDMVKDMVALTDASEPSKTVLEPACGNGNFLAEILAQKLAKCNCDDDAWTSLKSLFGIDIQDDNIRECKARLCEIFLRKMTNANTKDVMSILDQNIVCGNFLTKRYWSQGKELDKVIWFLDDEPRLF